VPAGVSALRDSIALTLGRHAVSSPRRIPRISPAAGGSVLSALLARARSGVALVAEVLVALALLAPALRRLSRPVELREAAPVRVRS
jgi:hypothetical protein